MGIETALIAGAVASGGAAVLDAKSQKKSVKSMEEQKAMSQDFIEAQMKQARGDLFKLFPGIQESQQQGLQAGLGVYGQSIPFQMKAFQQGNVGAQQQLLAGLPQIHNAILGKPINYGGLQAKTLQPGGLSMPQAPQFAPIQDPNTQGNQGSPMLDPNMMEMLGGYQA